MKHGCNQMTLFTQWGSEVVAAHCASKTHQGAGNTECDWHIQALLEHGKLRIDQILSLVAALQASDAEVPEGAVMTCLVNLVHSRYVQRARGCDAERPQRPLPATVKVRPLEAEYT